ncbi:hypothetical protein, partial [Streptomyces sp. NPDC127084]|uniref:hypothetical protein n=1 Tax=Streptomyces sp. NPDC127084 TaxID=3347133 RepID=UPI00365E2391
QQHRCAPPSPKAGGRPAPRVRGGGWGAAAGARVCAAAAVRPREAAALTGTAKLYRPAGDDIVFSFDAHLAAKDNMNPHRAHGSFRFSHYAANGAGGWARAKVDCLMTGGKVAVVTGVVTESDTPFKGKRVGVTVHDQGRHDRLGYTWIGENEVADVPKCLGAAPFETVEKGSGDFKVVPWELGYPQN